ncbi:MULTISPECIES: RNA polymerase sigma factor [Gimesia]|uniref:RNA polymerase sigma factor n=1 Tax=Gimesia chilikensis TaxID=2605989 RepID=A0A517PHR1_9PLAN|nr:MULTISPECIES: sigma-70 family RNA polymerase sigma factor [Gimesia]MCR9232482.1 sigma-70 family RNA polymerase sigma factor [bacterium]QDT18917.1 RNA polymerase sigma factor [Gimesia chilikensis]QDT83034.1 RNA polymerase sigma factor [Gimesia chilikensis]
MALTDIDKNLLKRCLAEEPGAWKDFVDRFIGLFTHVIHHTAHARSIRVTDNDIDDLLSEVFLVLLANDYRVLRNFRGQSSLATYLTVVSRRVIVKKMVERRMAEALGHVSTSSRIERVSDEQTRQQQALEDQEEIQNMIRQLPPADAQIVEQYHLQGKSYQQISSDLDIPENSIGPTLTRARNRMRENKSRTRTL